jgi:hypothetical protein
MFLGTVIVSSEQDLMNEAFRSELNPSLFNRKSREHYHVSFSALSTSTLSSYQKGHNNCEKGIWEV